VLPFFCSISDHEHTLALLSLGRVAQSSVRL